MTHLEVLTLQCSQDGNNLYESDFKTNFSRITYKMFQRLLVVCLGVYGTSEHCATELVPEADIIYLRPWKYYLFTAVADIIYLQLAGRGGD